MARPPATPSDVSGAIARLGERMSETRDAQNDRIDALFDRLDKRFDRLEAKVDLKVDQLDADTQREFNEARNDAGELRDLVSKLTVRVDRMEITKAAQIEASAAGAARGAGEAAGHAAAVTARVIAAETAKDFWLTKGRKLMGIGIGIAAVGAGIDNVPKILKWIADAFQFLMTGGPHK